MLFINFFIYFIYQRMFMKIHKLLLLMLMYPLLSQQQGRSLQTSSQTKTNVSSIVGQNQSDTNTSKTQDNNSSGNSTNKKQIYGVRWSLGDHFSYSSLFKTHPGYIQTQKYPKSSNYYIMAFNSDIQFKQDVFLFIAGTINTCSHRKVAVPMSEDHIQIQLKQNSTLNSTDAYIYKCYVNFDIRTGKRIQQNLIQEQQHFDQYQYLIYLHKTQFLYHNDPQTSVQNSTILNRKVNSIKQILFNGTFRSPLPRFSSLSNINISYKSAKGLIQQSVLVLGDWGDVSQQIQKTKGYIPVFGSIYNRLQWDDNLVVVIFLGDMAYDLVGEKYFQMLKYMEPITSMICFMPTPGNHDYSYHLDSFQLFAETFITPQWSKYYNFYYSFILGDYLFINYVPDNVVDVLKTYNVKSLKFIQEQLYGNYPHKLGQKSNQKNSTPFNGIPDPIYKQYHVIVFSHYPVVCSKMNDGFQSCQQNQKKLAQYLQAFTDFGMDLYLSGHLHYYERTHGMCWDKLKKQMKIQKYSSKQQYIQKTIKLDNEVYSQRCPIYVIDGTAGNNYFEQEQGAITPSTFTSKIIYNTGYSVMSLISEVVTSDLSKQKQKFIENYIEFRHYKMIQLNKSVLVDKFTKQLQVLQHNEPKQLIDQQQRKPQPQKPSNTSDQLGPNRQMIFKLLQVVLVSFLITIALIVCFRYSKSLVKKIRKQRKQSHARSSAQDMVEEEAPKTDPEFHKSDGVHTENMN